MRKVVQVPLTGDSHNICDRIVDGIVDEFLRRDPKSRLRIQAMGAQGMLVIGGQADSKADFDAIEIVQKIYREIGFTDDIEPFVNVEKYSEEQSKALVKGGASESVVVTGYATKETRELLPKPQVYTYALAQKIHRHIEEVAWLMQDGTVQAVFEGNEPVTVSLALQHKPGIEKTVMQQEVLDRFVTPFFTSGGGQSFINSMELFTDGGFLRKPGASGMLTGVHTYGGLIPMNDVVVAGKDPYAPSRAGTLMARYVARQLVVEGLATNALIKVVYAEGRAKPIGIEAVTGTGENLSALVEKRFDFRTEAIVEELSLALPMYEATHAFGWFGNEALPWEN